MPGVSHSSLFPPFRVLHAYVCLPDLDETRLRGRCACLARRPAAAIGDLAGEQAFQPLLLDIAARQQVHQRLRHAAERLPIAGKHLIEVVRECLLIALRPEQLGAVQDINQRRPAVRPPLAEVQG